MDKILEYNGYRFNICVKLNHVAERRIGGKCLHQVVINDLGATRFYLVAEVETSGLEEKIKHFEQKAMEYADLHSGIKVQKSVEEELLEQLGFK